MIRFVFFVGSSLSAVLCARIAMLYYQQESYQIDGYLRTLRRNWLRAFLPGLAVSVIGCAASGLLTRLAFSDWMLALGMLITLGAAVAAYIIQRKLPVKKPLAITARVKRLSVCMAAVSLGVSALVVYGAKVLSAALLLPLFAPVVLLIAALVMLPIEVGINTLFLRDAMRRLDAMPGLIKIGITGSWGKTSAKFMLETILSERYRVLVTPGSFNTSMGVTRVVRERLAPEHQVFIAEMGARHRGDIKLLCKLVRPRYGILTSVGPQHLETFRTQENILKEKFELARAIPQDGAMVFASDGGLNDSLYEKCACPKHLCGMRAEGMGLQARDIEIGPWGSRFTMTDGGAEVRCETKVLGSHNIYNLLAAATMARLLGMDLETIARGARRIQPVEHRLQLLDTAGGVTVIDDAFNANPVGARAALDVLRQFPGRRVIVTPGFVELGSEEAKYNRVLGEAMAESVDVAVLVGRRHTAPIVEGLREKGFDDKNLHIFASLKEASAHLSTAMRPGDVVLYENDLPDNYQE